MWLAYDDSLFSGPSQSLFWRVDYVPDDIVNPITALWVDEALSTPTTPIGFEDLFLAAADVFATELRSAGVTVVGRRAPAPLVARPSWPGSRACSSHRPLKRHVLGVSDNEGAEVLAHHVGLADGDDARSPAAPAAYAGPWPGSASRSTAR